MNCSIVSKLMLFVSIGSTLPLHASQQANLYPFKKSTRIEKNDWWIQVNSGTPAQELLVRVTTQNQVPAISLDGIQRNYIYIDGFGNQLPAGLFRWNIGERQRNSVRHAPTSPAIYNLERGKFVTKKAGKEEAWVPGSHSPNPFTPQDILNLVNLNQPVAATIVPTQLPGVPAGMTPSEPILNKIIQLSIPNQDLSIQKNVQNISSFAFMTCNELHQTDYEKWSKDTPTKRTQFTFMPLNERASLFNNFLTKFGKQIDVFVFQENGSFNWPTTFSDQFYIISSPDNYLCTALKKTTGAIVEANYLQIQGGKGKGIVAIIIETNDDAKRKIGFIDVHLPGSAAEDIQKNQEAAIQQIREYITEKTAQFNNNNPNSPLVGWIGGGDFNIDAKVGTNLNQVAGLLKLSVAGAPASLNQPFYTALSSKGTKAWYEYIFYSPIFSATNTTYEPQLATAEKFLITHGNLIHQGITTDRGRGYFSDHISVGVRFTLPVEEKERKAQEAQEAAQPNPEGELQAQAAAQALFEQQFREQAQLLGTQNQPAPAGSEQLTERPSSERADVKARAASTEEQAVVQREGKRNVERFEAEEASAQAARAARREQNKIRTQQEQAFFKAAQQGDSSALFNAMFGYNPIQVNFRDINNNNRTALMLAAMAGNISMVNDLLNMALADPLLKDKQGKTARDLVNEQIAIAIDQKNEYKVNNLIKIAETLEAKEKELQSGQAPSTQLAPGTMMQMILPELQPALQMPAISQPSVPASSVKPRATIPVVTSIPAAQPSPAPVTPATSVVTAPQVQAISAQAQDADRQALAELNKKRDTVNNMPATNDDQKIEKGNELVAVAKEYLSLAKKIKADKSRPEGDKRSLLIKIDSIEADKIQRVPYVSDSAQSEYSTEDYKNIMDEIHALSY